MKKKQKICGHYGKKGYWVTICDDDGERIIGAANLHGLPPDEIRVRCEHACEKFARSHGIEKDGLSYKKEL